MTGVINVSSGCAGFYKLEAVKLDEDGNEISRRVVADWFPNLITNQGLEYMGASADWLNACQVGTGSTAPAFTDTTLATYLVGTSTKQTVSSNILGVSPYYVGLVITYRFAVGVAAGNLTEIGIGKTTATGNLYSRALILDGGGSPTTITILSDEVLDASYEIRTYPPLSDSAGSVSISSVSYNYVVRAVNVNAANTTTFGRWGIPNEGTAASDGAQAAMPGSGNTAFNGVLGAITAATPTGTFDDATSVATAAYVGASLQRDGTQTYGLTDGNLSGGISAVKFSFNWCAYQISFSPAIPKTSSQSLTLTFRHTWSRATIP
jgi:hypothetical protein